MAYYATFSDTFEYIDKCGIVSSFKTAIIEARSLKQIRSRGLHLFDFYQKFSNIDDAREYLLSETGKDTHRFISLM